MDLLSFVATIITSLLSGSGLLAVWMSTRIKRQDEDWKAVNSAISTIKKSLAEYDEFNKNSDAIERKWEDFENKINTSLNNIQKSVDDNTRLIQDSAYKSAQEDRKICNCLLLMSQHVIYDSDNGKEKVNDKLMSEFENISDYEGTISNKGR